MHDGQVGRDFLDLLTTVVRMQLRRLPILYTDRRLDNDLVGDFMQDFVTERWERTVTALLAEATDDESLERLLHRIVRSWLIDQVRKTDRGSVLRRIKDHLAEDPAFEVVPDHEAGGGRWRLADSDGPPWGGRMEDLVAAAYKVPARAVRWSDPTRRPPIACATDLTAILREVMTAAGHQSLDLQQLVMVITQRFPATMDPESRTIDADKDAITATEPTPDLAWEAHQVASERASIAANIFAQLTHDERQLLPIILDGKAVETHLSCGRSTAYNRINKLKALIRELAGACDDPEQVVLEVLALCTS
ncbi:hypothetical protein AAH991_29870 [Microbispora sp. ZYX-F-249]|uniref:Sigma-70 family RNA polymerase sigma factor n=1 Tax=Microbispora maris TaxID=3144104 RepID=A0ABV0AWZ1_9ACTN